MHKHKIPLILQDDYQLLIRHAVGKSIKKILDLTENNISLLLEDGTVVSFLRFEEELIFDIELPDLV